MTRPKYCTASHLIWESNPTMTDNDWSFYRNEYPELNNAEIEQLFADDNSERLNDERTNLSHITVPNGILGFGRLGLWNGSPFAVLPDDVATVSDCLRGFVRGASELTIRVDEKGDLQVTESHHDGTNRYTFRAWREHITETQKNNIRARITAGDTDEKLQDLIYRYTYRLGDIIGDVYGWSYPYRPKCTLP